MKRREFTLGAAALVGVTAVMANGGRSRTTVQRPSPQVLRRSRNLSGETVNLRDYCAANGRGTDTQLYQELIDLRPARILYPADTRLMLDKPMQLCSDQVHSFSSGSAIDSEVDGYTMTAVGETSQSLGNLVQAIQRYSRTISLDMVPEIAAGDIILIADVVDPKLIKTDINVVDQVLGKDIVTRYPIGHSFDKVESFRLYSVYKPIRNLQLSGKVMVTNHAKLGGFLRIVNTDRVNVNGIIVENTGYIGISFENSLNGQFNDVVVRGAGASGLGFRSSKAIYLNGFFARNVRSDESLTFYDNVSHVLAQKIDIQQYLYGKGGNDRVAGNNILIDFFCSRINLKDVKCVGSSTYNVMINNRSDHCCIDNFYLKESNLGGIRVSGHSIDTAIGRGVISDVTDMVDQEGRKPVSAISVGSACLGTTLNPDITFDRIASGINVGSLVDERV